MAAKTAKEDQHFLDMMDQSKIPEMGLIGAKLVDMKENIDDNNAARVAHDAGVMKMLGVISSNQEAYMADIAENKDAIKTNREAITEIKTKNVRMVTLVTAAAGIIGGGVGDWLKGLLAP